MASAMMISSVAIFFIFCAFQPSQSFPAYWVPPTTASTTTVASPKESFEKIANKTPYGLYGNGPNKDEAGDLFEGDIAGINTLQYDNNWIRNVIKDPQRKWPQGVVAYEIDSGSFQNSEIESIQDAINELEQKTCIKFEERSSQEDYIYITALSGCFSNIGRSGGRQELSLETPGCMRIGTVVHEMLHALGIWHEQSRFDRDDYVTINWSNISPGTKGNFEKLDEDETQTFGLKYDYGSVMHYSSYSFAINPRVPTIVPIEDGVTIGQRDGMSDTDAAKINALYECGNRNNQTTV